MPVAQNKKAEECQEVKPFLEPAGPRLLVLPVKAEEKSKGGIYFPETSQENEQFETKNGVVVWIGKTAWSQYGGVPWCAVGDFIQYADFSGVDVSEGNKKDLTDPATGVKYRVINDKDVNCINHRKKHRVSIEPKDGSIYVEEINA